MEYNKHYNYLFQEQFECTITTKPEKPYKGYFVFYNGDWFKFEKRKWMYKFIRYTNMIKKGQFDWYKHFYFLKHGEAK